MLDELLWTSVDWHQAVERSVAAAPFAFVPNFGARLQGVALSCEGHSFRSFTSAAAHVLKGEQKPLSIGLIALLDDVAAVAKVAAASLDDVVAQAAKAGVKAAGVVIDDAAVTPRYVLGFAAARELPIVGKIAVGHFATSSLSCFQLLWP